MISFRTQTRLPVVNEAAIARNVSIMADRLADTYANNLRIAIVRMRAIASGRTLASVTSKGSGIDSPARGFWKRSVMAKNSWFWIQIGRRPGGKMPVYVSGIDKRGKRVFEPLPEMLAWFQVLNIPRAAWFPIMRAIKRRGIKPRDIQGRAFREAKVNATLIIADCMRKMAEEFFDEPR